MSQNDRDRHAGAAREHGKGSGYRGSYYGSDGFESDTAEQSYRGRGPKGYVRSDERLKEMICELLTDDPNIDASDITIEVADQVVRLTGSIEDREARQEVEALIERIGGVKGIDNRLRAKSAPQRPLPARALPPAMFDFDPGAANCDDRSLVPPKR